jgi:hypothetical protein
MIAPNVPDPILWRSASRFHNWQEGDLPKTLLGRWLKDGVIGVPDEIDANDVAKPFKAAEGARIIDRLLGMPKDREGHLRVSARGNNPHPWWVSVWLPTFDPEVNRNDGYAMINLMFPRAAFSGAARSMMLLDACEAIYRPDNCEFAGIHPENHLGRLQMKAYEKPLVFGPMFAGMYWGVFLGPGHIERFRRETIDALQVSRRRWFDSKGVFLAVSDDVAEADTPEAERKLVNMTEQLRRER